MADCTNQHQSSIGDWKSSKFNWWLNIISWIKKFEIKYSTENWDTMYSKSDRNMRRHSGKINNVNYDSWVYIISKTVYILSLQWYNVTLYIMIEAKWSSS